MPTWKHTGKEVSKAKAEESLKAIKGACFGCGTHSADCSIAKAAGEISGMMGSEPSVKEQIHAQIAGALAGAKFPVKTRLELTGTLIVARDAAHARLKKLRQFPAAPALSCRLAARINGPQMNAAQHR